MKPVGRPRLRQHRPDRRDRELRVLVVHRHHDRDQQWLRRLRILECPPANVSSDQQLRGEHDEERAPEQRHAHGPVEERDDPQRHEQSQRGDNAVDSPSFPRFAGDESSTITARVDVAG